VSSEPFSEEWWADDAFDGAPDASSAERRAARAICQRYSIRGVADAGYIANVLAHRHSPFGPTPIEPGLEPACRFLNRVYPALAAVPVVELLALVTESISETGR
jgi:hypothetical protein